jgi:mRNA-degrading endonuclease RelE of RelBE toxin-antitoxin system
MTLKLRWERQASRAITDLLRRDPERARRIRARIHAVAVQKMSGFENRWRLRVGTWRVVFTVDRDAEELVIMRVAPRKDAYG